jgi:ferredoxin
MGSGGSHRPAGTGVPSPAVEGSIDPAAYHAVGPGPGGGNVEVEPVGVSHVLDRRDFHLLFEALHADGYRVVGPAVRDGAIVYDVLASEADLPIGWTDRQEAGRYRLEPRTDGALFGYNVGPHSWKKYLYPSHERLWTAHREEGTFTVRSDPPEFPKTAFLGIRACELAAIEIQDRVFLGGVVDPGYASRRGKILKIAVQCGQSSPTCFCTSMGTGPAVERGFDLSVTELIGARGHRFLLVPGSEAGRRIVAALPARPAPAAEAAEAQRLVAATAASLTRSMPTEGIRERLQAAAQHPRWEEVSKRCLSCANCTLACPTCFCSTTEEVPDLTGDQVERWRRWDSCFTLQFTSMHGASARTSPTSRYRQWLTHKLSTWYDQFGQSGCVGCGRCITWCPVAIDITEEVRALGVPPPVPEKAP